MWLLISRRPLGEVSVPIRRHPICPAAVENLPARSKHRFLPRSDVNLASHNYLNRGLRTASGVGEDHFPTSLDSSAVAGRMDP